MRRQAENTHIRGHDHGPEPISLSFQCIDFSSISFEFNRAKSSLFALRGAWKAFVTSRL